MAEAKKARAKGTKSSAKSAPKADFAKTLFAAAAAPESANNAGPASHSAATGSQPVVAEALPASVLEGSDALRLDVDGALAVSAQGALEGAMEVNGKILQALQTQSEAVLALWRTALSASNSPEAFHAQTSATRQAYETASAQWQDVAAATMRWAARSLEPLQSALHRQGR